MKWLQEIKGLFVKNQQVKKQVAFSMEANQPDVEIGSIHEDNEWFHGTKFKVLTVEEIISHPDDHWKYTIKGTCELVN